MMGHRATTADEYRRRLADLGITPVEPDPETGRRVAAAMAAFLDQWTAATVGPFRAAQRRFDETMAPLVKALAPGAFFGDLLRLRELRGEQDAGAVEAAARLIQRYFRRRLVFHGNRWRAGVGSAFRRRQREKGQSEGTLWADLATGALFVAAMTIQQARFDPETGFTVEDAYNWVRARVREAVETDLLGRTLDATREILAENPSEIRDDRLPTPSAILDTAAQRIDMLLAAPGIDPDDVMFLVDYFDRDTSVDDLARRSGVTPGAIRQRASRAMRRLAERLGVTSRESAVGGRARRGGRRPSRRASWRTRPNPGR